MDHKKLSLLKELLVHNTMRDKPSDSSRGEREAHGKAAMFRFLRGPMQLSHPYFAYEATVISLLA